MRHIILSVASVFAFTAPAFAYNQAPTDTFEITTVSVPSPVAETCSLRLTPALASALALPAGASQTC